MSKVERLLQAGLIDEPVVKEVITRVETLSDEEVDALIAAQQKLGLKGKLFNQPLSLSAVSDAPKPTAGG